MLRRSILVALLSAAGAWAQSVGFWETRAPFPIAATEVSAAAIGEEIFVLCGITPDGLRSERLFIYDAVGDAWREGAPIPIALGADHCNVAAAGGKLYLLGAIRVGRGFLTNRTYVYDPQADSWAELSRMSIPRGASGVAVVAEKVFVIGGEAAAQSGRAAEVFDTARNRWDRLPDLPGTRTHLTAQAISGKVYAIGGRTGAIASVQGDVFEYDPGSNAWTARAPMPTPRAGIASGVIGGRIIVFGGEGPSGRPEQTYQQVEEYDPATDSWRSLAPMPTPRHGFYGASTGDGRIFLPAGGPRSGETFSQAHEAFHLAPSAAPAVVIAGPREAAGFAEAAAPGSIISLFGTQLSAGSAVASNLPLPTRLNGSEVRIQGAPAPLFFVSAGQINLLIPLSAAGRVELEAFNAGRTSALYPLDLAAAAPGIFTLDQSGSGQGAVLISGTGLVAGPAADGSRPASPGEALEIFAAGLGIVSNPPAPGAAAPAAPLSGTLQPPRVEIGGRGVEILFSGLAPGFAGVYQVNALLPPDITPGDAVELQVSIAGQSSNAVSVAIRR